MADSWAYSSLGEPVGLYDAITAKAGAAITKGQIVKLTAATDPKDGPTVQPAGAGEVAFGVAMQDIANGAIGKILKRGRVKVTAGGAISAPAFVKPGATGKVVAAVTTVTIPSGATAVTSTSAQPSMNIEGFLACGVAETDASADNDTLLISFFAM